MKKTTLFKSVFSLILFLNLFISTFAQSTAAVDGKWIPEGFPNVLYILEDGKKYTYYCSGNQNCDSLYNTYEAADGNHIPGVNDFTFMNDTMTVDLNFGNYSISHITFECDSNILNFSVNNSIWVRLGTNLNDCLSATIQETVSESNTYHDNWDCWYKYNDKSYDLLGREIVDLANYPVNSIYIKNGKKYLKTEE
ncbi:MAG: hypothetical protein RL293_745 [Bacteroidota bacterium]|jgi:hypothetical protein